MKKIFALLAGLSLFSSYVLPVSATDVELEGYDVYVVLGSKPTKYSTCCYVYNSENQDTQIIYYGETSLQYGDMVTGMLLTDDCAIDEGDGITHLIDIQFVDSAVSYYGGTEELTISKIDDTVLVLKNSKNKIYQYDYKCFKDMDELKNFEFETSVDWKEFAVGQTWNFIMNGEDAVLPLEMVSADGITVKPVSAVTANGDADGNGTLDILDIITVNKAILGKENLDPERIPYIDFNQNQVPDFDDALTMLKMIVGLT